MVSSDSNSNRELLSLKITLSEAKKRAQAGSNYADRVVAILLAGLAAETVVGITNGKNVEKFSKDLGRATSTFVGQLSYQKHGERAWAARIQAQHYGTVPDHDHTIEIVSGLDAFVRELLLKARQVDLTSVSIASLIDLPGVSKAVSSA